MDVKLLNVGCGQHYHADWVNVDLVPVSPEVIACNILEGLPFPDEHFDACYHSHVLEHLPPEDGKRLIAECHRVVRRGSILRVVVPDLEGIARNYLDALERAESGEDEAKLAYDWTVIEMIDQFVRTRPGGEMKRFLLNPKSRGSRFVMARAGPLAAQVWQEAAMPRHSEPRPSLSRRILSKSWAELMDAFAIRLSHNILGLLRASRTRDAFEEALFRMSGEVHRWMYDRQSLKGLLEHAGFRGVRVCRADESAIPNFSAYGLDIVDGQVYKPNSLYMEATKR